MPTSYENMTALNEYADKMAINKETGDKNYVFAILDQGEKMPRDSRFNNLVYSFSRNTITGLFPNRTKTTVFKKHKYREPTREEKSEAMNYLFDLLFSEHGARDFTISQLLRLRGDRDYKKFD